MSDILIDTSVWIDYFRDKPVAGLLAELIDNDRIATNDLILAELLPSIIQRKERKLGNLLLSVRNLSLSIDWFRIIEMQTTNLTRGFNDIGIPDLIIAQNAIDNSVVLFENDKHFLAMKDSFGLELFSWQR
ncbi:MAG: PIN domain-containing protein [Pyrinomonadaceae bacterium]